MNLEREFSYADIRKINKVLKVMKDLAKEDDYFATAVEQFETASEKGKVWMCRYLLEIYNTTDFNLMTLETAVILAAYPA